MPQSTLKVVLPPALAAAPGGRRLTGGRARPLTWCKHCHDLLLGGLAKVFVFASLDPNLPLPAPTSGLGRQA